MLILSTDDRSITLSRVEDVIVSDNDTHMVIIVKDAVRIYVVRHQDPIPLQAKSDERCATEVDDALLCMCDGI